MTHYLQRTVNRKWWQDICNIDITYLEHDIFSVPNKLPFFLKCKYLFFFFFPFLAATNRRLIFLVVYYGFLWLVLTPCCSLWIHMIHCGNCASLYLIEPLWIFLSLYVSLWLSLVCSSCLCLFLNQCGSLWLIAAYFGPY